MLSEHGQHTAELSYVHLLLQRASQAQFSTTLTFLIWFPNLTHISLMSACNMQGIS